MHIAEIVTGIIYIWFVSCIAVILTAFANVLAESIKQKKTPNTICREWADRYVPRIQRWADNTMYGHWKNRM